jgi:hypothetical protein
MASPASVTSRRLWSGSSAGSGSGSLISVDSWGRGKRLGMPVVGAEKLEHLETGQIETSMGERMDLDEGMVDCD